MASDGILEVTDANFDQEVLKSEQPVLIDFWAAWCGPCKALAPVVDEIAKLYHGKVKFAEDGRGPQYSDTAALRSAWHPDIAGIQGRPSAGTDCRLRSQGND